MFCAAWYTICVAMLIAIQHRFDQDYDDRFKDGRRAKQEEITRERYEKRWADDDKLYRQNMAKKRAKKDAKKAKAARDQKRRECGEPVRGDRYRSWPYGVERD